jgi:excisionase family DNA binding protein
MTTTATESLAYEIAAHMARMGVAKKRVYTLDEACTYTSLSQSAIRDAVRRGDLKDVDLDGRLRFAIEDLERFVNERRR